ncbi:hypothetical protein CkaCkLH20_05973 [Colletotrichum karsti]|uniref:Major facilitator superfamily (MFS) profile domain-containing protein n=1 Tax=Colletotrichum karsti TaxID=1095194 RepID=A0A9P6IDA4_9PEZI|nr:uncharacterized protein CkaCkLH20_05973 [Colletotrichum karsti]KAF9876565.1 hypothetical protein CkaCkLH20_05973 [Colletotrichum karsti]
MGGHSSGNAAYDAALQRRQALMGASGARALVKNWKVARIAAFACIGGVLYGYNQGMFSGILAMPSFEKHMDGYTKNPTQKGWLTAILELGAWVGAILSGFIAEVCSRKYGVLIATAVFILGVIVQITSISGGHESILGGRFITGMGVGSLSMIVPLYNSECAPPEVRGALVALQQLAITFGIMISFWIDYGCNYIGGTTEDTQSDAAWLVPICLQLGPAAVLLVGMIWMPFSPRWLIHHGREEEARRNLANLRDLPETHELIELEFLEIKAQSLFEKRSIAEHFPHLQELTAWNTFKLQFVAMKSLFTTKAMFKRVIVATVTMFFQQWTGINAVLYYAPQIFSQLGLSATTTSLLATGVVGVVMFIATIPAVLWIDRVGRKPVLSIGAIGMGTCHIIIAVILAKNIDRFDQQPAAGWAAVVMVWLFVVHFGYSWGPCAWIIIAEVWPLSTRPYGVSLGASSNWMNNFIVGQVTPDMLVGITYGTYILFGLLTYLGAAFIWFFVPETKRLSLEEMDLVFGSEGTAQADFERMEEINTEIGLTATLVKMSAVFDISDSTKLEDDFSVIERLADAIRIEDDIKVSQEDRNAIVQDLYEGPRQCQCCINWMTECPHGVDLTALEKEEEPEKGNPIIVRRRVTPSKAGSLISIHSIEICHAATRKALIDIFQSYDSIVHNIKYLAFLAPFHQFFWNWEKFENGITEEKDEEVKKILLTLKWLVKRELAEAFAVSKELTSHGVITFKYLWTIFPPGELIYSDDDEDERFFVVEQINTKHATTYSLVLGYVNCDGKSFGKSATSQPLWHFSGTRPIDSLVAFPAKYLKNLEGMKSKLVERGRKFASLAGQHYKSYRPRHDTHSTAELRVMVDSGHSEGRRKKPSAITAFFSSSFPGEEAFIQRTGLIVQAPIDSTPPGGHIPLMPERDGLDPRNRSGPGPFKDWSNDDPERRRQRPPGPLPPPRPMPGPMPQPPGWVPSGGPPPPPPPLVRRRPAQMKYRQRASSTYSSSSESGDESIEDARSRLSDLLLSLCVPWVMGFDLKAKCWRSLDVDRISDIEWNMQPFESLVLPEGYKELILAFVESQVKDKDTFDDVINGKGGGLVALLAGEPGVGKTLTAESVAEKIKAPLFKMELGEYNEDGSSSDSDSVVDDDVPRRNGNRYDRNSRNYKHKIGDFTKAFELAARWGAVLLIDECDTYLEQRSDGSSKRNRLVSRFLRELEYYPSLLFLTTNRERCLDPAVYSRIHLTINYPALDEPSRQKIWETFLEKNGSSMSDLELLSLAKIEVDGRRIRNIVKTSSIMAKREARPIRFDDVKKVMRITEGMEIQVLPNY